jgi:hypothetical protein
MKEERKRPLQFRKNARGTFEDRDGSRGCVSAKKVAREIKENVLDLSHLVFPVKETKANVIVKSSKTQHLTFQKTVKSRKPCDKKINLALTLTEESQNSHFSIFSGKENVPRKPLCFKRLFSKDSTDEESVDFSRPQMWARDSYQYKTC